MATLTNVTKNSSALTGVARVVGNGIVFYGWMFLFTIPQFAQSLTNVAKNAGTITSIAKN
jgi:hypothetical protein